MSKETTPEANTPKTQFLNIEDKLYLEAHRITTIEVIPGSTTSPSPRSPQVEIHVEDPIGKHIIHIASLERAKTLAHRIANEAGVINVTVTA